MAFWITLIISLAFQIVGELLRPKPKFDNPKPSALGDFSFPTADATRVIPVFFGTCKLRGPNIVWFGDLKSRAIKKKVKTGMFSSTNITQGFKYYLGAQVVFSYGPIDELIDFRFDDKSVIRGTFTVSSPLPNLPGAYQLPPGSTIVGGISDGFNIGSQIGGQAQIAITITETADTLKFIMNAPSLLDNDDPKNGVGGPVTLYKGTFTQPFNAYLKQKWGEVETSAFRPLFYGVLEHCYLGNSDTPPPVSAIARRTPNQLGLTGGKHNISGDANVACACYEVMTDLLWGLKMPASIINTASFIDCGNRLFAEGIGISMLIDTAMQGRALLSEMLRHVDGVIYPDPETKLYTMALARKDYEEEDLFVVDHSVIKPGTFELSRVSWEDTKNTTTINYTDRAASFEVRNVAYQNSANVFARRGQIDNEIIDFLGLSNKNAALKVAARANKTRSSPLARVQFETNRRGRHLRPNSVFKLVKPDFGIASAILRVIDIRFGTLDNPKITVTATEDIFAVNAIAFTAPAESGWIPPSTEPTELRFNLLEEVPYGLLGEEKRFVMALGARDEAITLGFEVWSDPTGLAAYTYKSEGSPTLAAGTLKFDYSAGSAPIDNDGFVLENLVDADLLEPVTEEERSQGKTIAIIGVGDAREIIAWKNVIFNVDGDEVEINGVVRGAFDTVPLDHPAGTPVLFLDDGVPLTDVLPYAEDISLTAKLPTFSSRKTMSLSAVDTLSLTTDSRAFKPYPPGFLRVNGLVDPAQTVGHAVLTGNIRDKVLEGINVYPQDVASAPERAGLTYTVKVYVGGVLVETVAGLPSPGYTYTGAQRGIESSDGSLLTKFVCYAVENGYESRYAEKEFLMTGFGMTFGTHFGGSQF